MFYSYAPVPPEITLLLEAVRQRQTYICQYELIGAITPFVSLPPGLLHGRPVELYIDNSPALSGLIRGYSGLSDSARIINTFHFAIARLCLSSLWIDYVPSESNPADEPSRFHEMSDNDVAALEAKMGAYVPMCLPAFADQDGSWLSYDQIAASLWEA